MTRSISRVALRLTACALLAASGCTLLRPPVDRSRFYLLTSIAGDEPARIGKPITLGVGPVHLPDYLDRPEVVIRTGPNQIELSPTDRWAEPVKSGFRRVFADNLSRLIKTERVLQFPWYRGTHLDFQVHASVQRFSSISCSPRRATSWRFSVSCCWSVCADFHVVAVVTASSTAAAASAHSP